ncbi:MAG: Do family serine endopeptidase [Bacteroidota bacterium]
MKSILGGVIGSILTLSLVMMTPLMPTKTITIEKTSPAPALSAKYSMSQEAMEDLDFTTTAEKVMPAVVHITSSMKSDRRSRRFNDEDMPDSFRDFFGPFMPREDEDRERQGTGSGVIISDDGYIITNNHVVEDASKVTVTLFDNRDYEATIIGTDPSTDLALIKINEGSLPFLTMEDSDDVKVGQWVLAVGNPFNLNSTVTAGIVSAKGRNINILRRKSDFPIESFIQTDAVVNPGNSGGALVNLDGELVGINTAIASPTGSYAGYAFAVPSNIAAKVIKDLLDYGLVQRGFIGAIIREVNGEFARENDLTITSGVYVDSLVSNSAAKEGGIEAGDVITKVDGVGVKSSPELLEMIGRKRPGDKLTLTVDRKGRDMDFEVVLKNRDGNTGIVEKEAEEVMLSRLGIAVDPLSEEELDELGIKGGVKVSAVRSGIVRSNTDIEEGFVITHVSGQAVDSETELMDILKEAEEDKRGVMLEGVYPDSERKYYYAFGFDE